MANLLPFATGNQLYADSGIPLVSRRQRDLVLLSFAYLEEDGVLLCIALTIALGLLLIAAGAVWQAMSAAGWVGGLF
jgi:hypothetical protein